MDFFSLVTVCFVRILSQQFEIYGDPFIQGFSVIPITIHIPIKQTNWQTGVVTGLNSHRKTNFRRSSAVRGAAVIEECRNKPFEDDPINSINWNFIIKMRMNFWLHCFNYINVLFYWFSIRFPYAISGKGREKNKYNKMKRREG